MIYVYYLPVDALDDTEQVAGTDLIHDAVLECTDQANVRKLTMDTTYVEHDQLSALALEVRAPTDTELELFYLSVIPYVPDPDALRAEEILASSPDVITMPEIWELLRIIGRRLGYRFDA